MLMRQIIAGDDDHGHLKVQPRSTSASRALKARQERLMSAGRELQQQAAGQGMFPKPKGPSVVARVQKAVDTNTAMIRTMIADGKERLENGKKQQARTDAAEAQASEAASAKADARATAKPGSSAAASSSAEAKSSTEPAQEALFDLGADNLGADKPSTDNPNEAAKKN